MPAVAARAKVNLRLAVLAREDAGFHQIETIFCALELADELDIDVGGSGLHLDVRGADLGDHRSNLVHRAAVAFFASVDSDPAARIVLHKRIPAGAGLGGGSSDAAATLLALNQAHGSPLDDDALVRIGGSLGSDVPFFLARAGLALAWGRGDHILPLPPLPQRPVLVVAPPFAFPTADAYRALAALRASADCRARAHVLPPAAFADWSAVRAIARNDFERVAFERHPELRTTRDALLAAGADLAMLAGSGSAVFAIFGDHESRDRAAQSVLDHSPAFRTFATTTARGDVAPRSPRG